jgi:uncharacterized protein YjiS (DUF1127 family)
MSSDEDVEASILRYRELNSTERDILRRRLIARARRARENLMQDLWRQFLAALWQGVAVGWRSCAGLLARRQASLAARYRERLAIARLQALDDRTLMDIGIRRSEIEAIVHAHGNDNTRVQRAGPLAA